MLKGIAWRMGFIFCLALTARIIGGFFAPAHPPEPVIREDVRAGVADELVPTSPEMRRAIAEVQASGQYRNEGAQLTYGHGADSVTATPFELAKAREMVRARAMARRFEDKMAEAEEQPDAVSYKPGEPMLDPTPDAR